MDDLFILKGLPRGTLISWDGMHYATYQWTCLAISWHEIGTWIIRSSCSSTFQCSCHCVSILGWDEAKIGYWPYIHNQIIDSYWWYPSQFMDVWRIGIDTAQLCQGQCAWFDFIDLWCSSLALVSLSRCTRGTHYTPSFDTFWWLQGNDYNNIGHYNSSTFTCAIDSMGGWCIQLVIP